MLYKVATGESEPHEAVVIPLWSARDQGAAPAAATLERHRELAYTWELAPLKLAPGSIITFFADARDFDAIKGPNVGKSRELRLRIVSKEDAAREFDDARRELREELARMLAMQKQAMTPVDNAARTLEQGDRLPQPQRDDLNNASMIQRQVGSRFNGREEGLAAQIRRMLDDLRNFKMTNPDVQKQMEDMLARVDQVARAQRRAGRAGDRPSRQGPRQSAARGRRPAAVRAIGPAAAGSRGRASPVARGVGNAEGTIARRRSGVV